YHTWHVTNWSNIERKTTSPKFEAGGWQWRILLFPYGNKNLSKISIYLKSVDSQVEYADLHVCVQFAFILWNSKEPTEYVGHYAYHRFTAQESDWGFGKFYDQNKLFTPSDDRIHPLIENDACNITALVRVLEDPTGTLWSDRKYSPGYTGLKNLKVNTFLNSVIQSLYFIKYFRKAVYQIPMENDKSAKSIGSALQQIFYDLNVSDSSAQTTELAKFFGWNIFLTSDVRKFIGVLRDNIEDKLKNTKADGTISKLFGGKMKTYIKCVNVDYESLRIEDYYDIQLNVKGCKTLDDSFMKYMQENLEGDNKYDAEGYGLQVANKSVIFESFPPVLHIHLDRFEYDTQSNTRVKINNRYEFPMEIDLQKYLSPDVDKSKSHKYLLHGVLVHGGSNKHNCRYYALLRPERNHRWIKFDGIRVTPVSVKEVLENNYGGDDCPYNNAYLLVYIREPDINEILSSMLPEDLPKHLCKEEKASREQKKKELAENMQIWVLTEDTLKNHKGFDLANFNAEQHPLSEVFQIKFLKKDTYDDFKITIAAKFKIPADQIRFWVMINLQNKTVRPRKLIIDNFLGKSMEEVKAKLSEGDGELRLYMEILEKPITINVKKKPPPEMIIFLKYFNPDTQSLDRSLGHLCVQKNHKIDTIFPILYKKTKLKQNTPLDIYEEVKPDFIEKKMPKLTFSKSEMQDGDIICFQKTLTNKDIPQFYESLLMNVIVQFKSKFGYKDLIPEFSLVLNKNMTYEAVANQVAAYLNTDPSRLRFTSVTGKQKNDISTLTEQTLSEILNFSSS
ncbi:7573_t:CDS:10, partial [Racocetra persica]